MRRLWRTFILGSCFILIGYWLCFHNVLSETMTGHYVDQLMMQLTPEKLHLAPSTAPAKGSQQFESLILKQPDGTETTISFNPEEIPDDPFDADLVAKEVLTLVNDLRVSEELVPLTSNQTLRQAATIRAKESAETFEHIRPNGDPALDVLKGDAPYAYQMAGENLGMSTIFGNEVRMSEFIFDGWKESPGHYENMVRPEFTELGVGIYEQNNELYITQIFGTPLE